ncbi:hypothetical protein IMG5_154310 [Ichthyophthirius multifiliis]|uniref:Transmembrane protein n=1 Tax=Ichthyophthirius multifiliis TaxID=5932 RepID=G0QZ43_ICHMU|nr:hypothetical protein IMG5_154310 [Ichthyophthirius multifiliis]EGR29510.1 hypothetical protein IMG5_154310 [Ichthyophthirius multifiliis]|eukprot:XP_004030746.1 hypothetical protein IMG5_154310 [Ichthyophthirius multifiliis]
MRKIQIYRIFLFIQLIFVQIIHQNKCKYLFIYIQQQFIQCKIVKKIMLHQIKSIIQIHVISISFVNQQLFQQKQVKRVLKKLVFSNQLAKVQKLFSENIMKVIFIFSTKDLFSKFQLIQYMISKEKNTTLNNLIFFLFILSLINFYIKFSHFIIQVLPFLGFNQFPIDILCLLCLTMINNGNYIIKQYQICQISLTKLWKILLKIQNWQKPFIKALQESYQLFFMIGLIFFLYILMILLNLSLISTFKQRILFCLLFQNQ